MAISDEIAVNCAYKARHGEDYPPKIPRIINAESQKRRTPLFSHIHILRWLLPPWLSCLQSLATRFSAPTLHRLGPMAAFAGIFVQPLYAARTSLGCTSKTCGDYAHSIFHAASACHVFC